MPLLLPGTRICSFQQSPSKSESSSWVNCCAAGGTSCTAIWQQQDAWQEVVFLLSAL